MKNYFYFVAIIIVVFIFSACSRSHFISDRNYRNQVHDDYLMRRKIAEGRNHQLFTVMDSADISMQEREALEFLYAYMPYSDLADYDGDFFLNEVKYAFKARDFFHWGKTIPDDIFRHFVLVYRVNNENLDTSRISFFNELKDRVKDMTMYDAALEVNHWCHEKVVYRPTDIRTSAPLSTVRTSYGRCGEESTFTVTAMRSVGIPARQCYTPRWAHTDDNHAWVEVWVDGKWYFIGACEPDAELNMGWFAFPATRTMMVHSNAFGKYKGDEEINYKTELFSRINMLKNYTDTKKITVNVIDKNGRAVENADVKFKLYNYAEYYPIATGKTDKGGKSSVTTGLGDLLIWACKDSVYNYAKIDVRKQDNITVKLTRQSGPEYVELLEMTPPVGIVKKSEIPQSEIDDNNIRLQQEDSIRNAYMATFPNENDIAGLSNENLTKEQIWHFVDLSEGNYAEMEKFLNNNSKKSTGLYLYDYLNSLQEKDLRDTPADILQQQLTYYSTDKYPVDVYIKGILPARISNEMIRPWRKDLKDRIVKTLGNSVTSNKIMSWIKNNIEIDNDGNYFNCPISPCGVFDLKHSDSHSRDILYIAACRAMDIPAYLDNATNQLFTYDNGKWNIVSFEEVKKVDATGTLVLMSDPKSEIQPIYWTHYTIAKFDNGDFVTFDYENDPRVATFPAKLELEEGYYMLSTGNRYSDGATLSRLEFFNIAPGQIVSKQIILRPLSPRDIKYGKIDMSFIPDKKDNNKNVTFYAGDKQLIVCFIDPSREPTKHLFKDIYTYKSQFEKWGGNILFVIPSDKRTDDLNASQWNFPKQSKIMYDENSAWINNILSSTKQEFKDNFPLVFIVEKDGTLVFKSEGYRIGTGELLYNSLKK